MNQAYFRMLFQPKLENPLLIVGLPGIGNIGEMVTRFLIDFFHAELFAEMYSPSFPDYVIIDGRGICRPPRYEFYVSTVGKNLVILTGDAQPVLENIPAHYEASGEVLDFASKLGCKFIIAVEGFPSQTPTKDIYVAATSKKMAKEYTNKNAVIYKGGRIIGTSGLLLGLAKVRGLQGICLLSSTSGLTVDHEAAFNIYHFLLKILGVDVREGFGETHIKT